jgi:hypothetical protein
MEIDIAKMDAAAVLSFTGKKKREAEDGPYLQEVTHLIKCRHDIGFIVDDKLDSVKCTGCGEKLNPMWALKQLSQMETRWHRAHEQYQDEMKRLKDRSRTKCRYCGEMTPISRT